MASAKFDGVDSTAKTATTRKDVVGHTFAPLKKWLPTLKGLKPTPTLSCLRGTVYCYRERSCNSFENTRPSLRAFISDQIALQPLQQKPRGLQCMAKRYGQGARRGCAGGPSQYLVISVDAQARLKVVQILQGLNLVAGFLYLPWTFYLPHLKTR